jgi:hypothetical protein
MKTPGLFKEEARRDKMICLCSKSKMYWASDIAKDRKKDKTSCKSSREISGNNVDYKKIMMYYFMFMKIKY